MKNIKALGQHWLKDRATLEAIVDFANVNDQDLVLEIGPGLGTLTSCLLKRVQQVVAVEFDSNLASNLPKQFPGKNLTVIHQDILRFDLASLGRPYKVVANLPYYITSKIIRYLLEAATPPRSLTILVQKEVAERLAQLHGASVLGLAVENRAVCHLGAVVPAKLFTPAPQVDSQVLRLELRDQALVPDDRALMRLIKLGFAAKRKKIRSSLSAGLTVSKAQAEQYLLAAQIDPDQRAEKLVFADWQRLNAVIKNCPINRAI